MSNNIRNKFIEWEKNSGVYDIKVDGFSIWHLVRVSIFIAILKEDFTFEQIKRESSIVKKPKGLFKYVLLLKNMFQFISQTFKLMRTDILVVTKSENRQLLNNQYEDKFFDQIELENGRITVFEFPDLKNENLHYKNLYKNERIIPADIIYLIEGLRKKFTKRKHIDTSRIYQLINVFVKDNFNQEIPLDTFNQNVTRLIERQVARQDLFQKLLKLVHPKALILKSSYDPMSQFLLFYANKMGVQTFELQHGHIYKDHPGYIRPHLSNEFLTMIYPKVLLVENLYYKQILTENGWSESELKVCGDIVSKQNQVNQLRLDALRVKVNGYDNIVTVIIQHTLSEEISLHLEKADTMKSYLFIVKLHPRLLDEQLHFFKEVKKLNNVMLVSNENSLEECFEVSTSVIGVYSTGVIDALKLGLIVDLLDLKGVEFLQDLIDDGLVNKISSINEITEHNSLKNQNVFMTEKTENKLNLTIEQVLQKLS